jgi:serine/threonine protein kinase
VPTRESGVVGDRYVLGEVIGRGGMADVYRAEDRVLRRPVAVKVMREVAADPRERARFAGEARTLARLSHPGLVPVLDAGTSQERPYLVMELVEGPSLAECCRGVALDPPRVAAIGAELATALAYVHACGVVHRDIKPSNVLLDRSDRVRLTDFGIARLLSDDASGYTATGTTIGTAAYLAPEQVRGERVGAAADVYALGLVLLEALTGERAYRGSPTEAALARLSTPPPMPRSLPEEWRVLVRQMTTLEEDLRPPAEEVAQRLRDVAVGTDASAATAVIRRQAPGTRVLIEPAPGVDTAPALVQGRRRWAALWARFPSIRPAVAALAVFTVVLVVAAAFMFASTSDRPNADADVPADTPNRLKEPLQDLHDAVKGR